MAMGTTVSIHAPNEGSDDEDGIFVEFADQFQSTLPMKGATSAWAFAELGKIGFNPRSQ